MLSQTGFLNRLMHRLLRCNKSGFAIRANKSAEYTQALDWLLLKACPRTSLSTEVTALLQIEQHMNLFGCFRLSTVRKGTQEPNETGKKCSARKFIGSEKAEEEPTRETNLERISTVNILCKLVKRQVFMNEAFGSPGTSPKWTSSRKNGIGTSYDRSCHSWFTLDEDLGGYHLVWPRDLVQTASALLAFGHREIPLRALVWLACIQQTDGPLPQNSWVTGDAYWSGKQLDEVAAPILLAWRCKEAGILQEFDPWELVFRAAAYIVQHAPLSAQDRCEIRSPYTDF